MRRPLVLAASCLVASTLTASTPHIDISELVRDQGIDPERSTLIVRSLEHDVVWLSHPERLRTRFPPASTSKIPHTLIALESGVATPETVFDWDGVERFASSWNADQTLASAFRLSAVWVYQRLTSNLGHATMTSWIDRFDYGNETIGGVDDLTTYWLRGPLETSAIDQVDFLDRLVRHELPVSTDTYDAAWPLMVWDRGDHWTLRAKTGWMHSDEVTDIGWFVGWVETKVPDPEPGQPPKRIYCFALNLDMPNASFLDKREAAVRHVLVEIGILPASARD